MFNFKNASIQKKFALGNIFVSAVIIFITCLAFITYDYITFRQGLARNLSSLTQMMAQNISAALVFDDPLSAEETITSLKVKPQIVSVHVYDSEGQLFAHYTRKKAEIHDGHAVDNLHINEHRYGKNILEVISPIILDEKKIGKILIVSDLSELSNRVNRYMIISFVILLVSLMIAVLISFIITKPIIQPIRQLTFMVQNMAKGDLSQKIKVNSKDEVGVLGESFNRMAEDLKGSLTSIDNFTEAQNRLEEVNQNLKNSELEIKEANKELAKRIAEAEQLNASMTGRELRIIEIKEEVNKLSEELGRPAPYELG